MLEHKREKLQSYYSGMRDAIVCIRYHAIHKNNIQAERPSISVIGKDGTINEDMRSVSNIER